MSVIEGLLVFAFGGFVGALTIWLGLVHELSKSNDLLPWRRRAASLRYLGSFGGWDKLAEQSEQDYRLAYGYRLIATMAELGGPRPIPKTKEGVEALLQETERRFQGSLTKKSR
jgi:hypothetical protein